MRKAILIVWMLLIISCAALASCPDERAMSLTVKKALFDHLRNPSASALGTPEVRDLIELFVSERFISGDCDYTGSSGHPITALLAIAGSIPDTALPRCSDGTIYGECSEDRPHFCYSGKLKIMCHGPDRIIGTGDDCGCGREYELCMADGQCQPQPIQCTRDDDCGPAVYSGFPECRENSVVDNYLFWRCSDPGTISSSCGFFSEERVIEDCAPGACLAGSCV